MKYELMTEQEMNEQVSGEGLTLTAVMAVLATAIIAVVVYRMFMSNKGSATVPGGWKFSWRVSKIFLPWIVLEKKLIDTE